MCVLGTVGNVTHYLWRNYMAEFSIVLRVKSGQQTTKPCITVIVAYCSQTAYSSFAAWKMIKHPARTCEKLASGKFPDCLPTVPLQVRSIEDSRKESNNYDSVPQHLFCCARLERRAFDPGFGL